MLPSLPASVASVALQMMFAVAVIVSLFCSVLFCLMNISATLHVAGRNANIYAFELQYFTRF